MQKLPNLQNKDYWNQIQAWAKENNSDGCTMARDIFLPACWEHDLHCSTHHTLLGDPIDSATAAARFREVIQMLSFAKKASLVAQVRWFAVRFFGPKWKPDPSLDPTSSTPGETNGLDEVRK